MCHAVLCWLHVHGNISAHAHFWFVLRRRTTSGASMSSPHAFPAHSSQSYAAPSDDQAQRAALYIEGIGWSTPAAVSPRMAPASSSSGAVGSSPLARQSSIMPDWSVAEEANHNQVS